MLAAEHQPDLFANVALPKHELLEIRRSTISKHHEKTGYNYPTIRLPHTFEALSGLSTRIFQTVHHGALAFLVVVSPAEVSRKARQLKNDVISAKPPSLHGEGRRFESGRAYRFFLQSDTFEASVKALSPTRIMAKKKYNDKKLYNSKEELHYADLGSVRWNKKRLSACLITRCRIAVGV